MTTTLAINIGGTTTKWALVPHETPDQFHVMACESHATLEKFRAFLTRLALGHATTPDRVTIGFPGPVNSSGQVSVACTWMPGQDLGNFDLKAETQRIWPNAQISVINDVSAYGQFLLQKGHRDFCVLNIGSGIGSKLYISGLEVVGPSYRGGEIGHWADPAVSAELVCDCGGARHVGAISSGRGALRFARLCLERNRQLHPQSQLYAVGNQPEALSSGQFISAAKNLDPFAIEILSEAMAPLARAAALIHLASGCERFMLVGGFAAALGSMLPALLARHSAAACWRNGFDWQSAYTLLLDEVRASLMGLHYHGVRCGSV
jgi:C7-cyclitol 7-kinase